MKKYYLLLFVGITMFDVSIAQTYSDSIQMDSIIHNLPDIMVTGEHPVVKVAKGKLVYDMNRLNENKGVDNVYEAIKGIPTIDESGSGVTLAGKSVTIL
nr:signal protein [Bacteroidales bacterium]